MVNISRYFLAAAHTLSNQSTNPNNVYEAMKRTMKTSLEYRRATHLKNLYNELKENKIGIQNVETMQYYAIRSHDTGHVQ